MKVRLDPGWDGKSSASAKLHLLTLSALNNHYITFPCVDFAFFSFLGRGLSPQKMVGLGRAAMPQLGVGRGRALLPSFPAGQDVFVSPVSEPQTEYSQPSLTGNYIKLF